MSTTERGRGISVLARNLRPHHVGKTFDDLGRMFSITFDRDGATLLASDGLFHCDGDCVLEWRTTKPTGTPMPTGKPRIR